MKRTTTTTTTTTTYQHTLVPHCAVSPENLSCGAVKKAGQKVNHTKFSLVVADAAATAKPMTLEFADAVMTSMQVSHH
jgi:hypothetical protein